MSKRSFDPARSVAVKREGDEFIPLQGRCCGIGTSDIRDRVISDSSIFKEKEPLLLPPFCPSAFPLPLYGCATCGILALLGPSALCPMLSALCLFPRQPRLRIELGLVLPDLQVKLRILISQISQHLPGCHRISFLDIGTNELGIDSEV